MDREKPPFPVSAVQAARKACYCDRFRRKTARLHATLTISSASAAAVASRPSCTCRPFCEAYPHSLCNASPSGGVRTSPLMSWPKFMFGALDRSRAIHSSAAIECWIAPVRSGSGLREISFKASRISPAAVYLPLLAKVSTASSVATLNVWPPRKTIPSGCFSSHPMPFSRNTRLRSFSKRAC